METIKVNMNPNPLDVQTIHASQNDGEARQWEFELHNNGELIDTSEVTEQLFFKAYKGGTEQLLPENGSTPTTSPFKGDIRYPQGLLTDQEFLYRESPTEEDGLAKITDIKGNTLNWNQISIVPFTEARGGVTFTRSDDRTTLQMSGTSTSTIYKPFSEVPTTTVGHVYYVDKGSDSTLFLMYNDNAGIDTLNTSRRAIGTATAQKSWFFRIPNGTTIDVTAKPMIIDLTQMFGSGNEPSTVEEFTSLFPLPYYAYNQGTLLSFNGNGIKTVGFNQWDEKWEAGGVDIRNGVPVPSSVQIRSKNFCPLIGGKTYYMTCGKTDGGSQNRFYLAICFYDDEQKFISATYANNLTFAAPSNASCFKLTTNSSTVVYGNTYNNDICINISDPEKNGTYEPYTSSTLSLPISTYFPTGMKSARNAYDELTPTKAITRIGAVDLGSLSWVIDNGAFRSTSGIPNMVQPQASAIGNILCSLYRATSQSAIYATANNMCVSCLSYTNNVLVRNDSYTSASDFKTAMSGVYLYYELATPTETSFTTASLVTENAEIPLSNEDGILIGKCTEQLSAEPGFHDAKIKLADSDGECYSNKIQLHIERSPQ